MEQGPTAGPQWTVGKLFQDPTPKGVINGRILHNPVALFEVTDLSDEEQERLLRILTLVARKLAAVWSHAERYRQIETELVEAAKTTTAMPSQPLVIDLGYSQDLFLEFEEFLFQLKSTLDHVVKVPSVILGPKVWSLTTWGDKGDRVLNAIARNFPKKYSHHAAGIRQLVVAPHKTWMRDVIEARDKTAHYLSGGVNYEFFAVRPDGKGGVRVPMWSEDQTVEALLEVIWHNLFRLIEDFVHVFVYLRVDTQYVMKCEPSPVTSRKSSWTVYPKQVLDQLEAKGMVKPFDGDDAAP